MLDDTESEKVVLFKLNLFITLCKICLDFVDIYCHVCIDKSISMKYVLLYVYFKFLFLVLIKFVIVKMFSSTSSILY